MGSYGAYPKGTWTSLAAVLLILTSSVVLITPTVGATPGDLMAPVYSDGDWWNYTVDGPLELPTKIDEFVVDL
jgi:hypothetical protein